MSDDRASEKARRNFGKIFGLKFLGEFYLIAPILVLYYTANGLSAVQIFTIQAVFHLAVLLLEVPSGYLADVVGRRRTLILGAVFFPLGLALYAAGRSFAVFILAELALAVSAGMRTGCDSALIFDSLRRLGRESEYKRFEGRAATLARAGSAISSVSGGLLAAVFLRLPFLVNIAAALPMIPLAVSLTEPEREPRRSPHPLKDILHICGHCLRRPDIRPVVLYCGLLTACHLTGLWAYFLFYRDIGIGAGWLGFLFAAFQLAGSLGGLVSHAVSERFGAAIVLLSTLLSPMIFILFGVTPGPWLLALIPANAFLWNLAYPVLLERLNQTVGSDVRATVLSLASLAGSSMFVVISPLFGRLADAFSLGAAFAALGGFFLVAGAPLLAAIHGKKPGPPGLKDPR